MCHDDHDLSHHFASFKLTSPLATMHEQGKKYFVLWSLYCANKSIFLTEKCTFKFRKHLKTFLACDLLRTMSQLYK